MSNKSLKNKDLNEHLFYYQIITNNRMIGNQSINKDIWTILMMSIANK